jgi:hypothetical protein
MQESEIRPQKLVDKYYELSAKDAKKCFANSRRFSISCIACGGENHQFQFKKNDFEYTQCLDCDSLFQSPRPSIESYEAFYQNSDSSQFWAKTFFPAVAESRREKMFRPRVERLSSLCQEKNICIDHLIEIGSGFGIFLEEWRKCHPTNKCNSDRTFRNTSTGMPKKRV